MRDFSDCHVVIHGWMATMASEQNLSTTDMLLYAIIWGFSQGGAGCFNGKMKYLEKWLNCSKPTVSASLKKLVDKGLIDKQETDGNGCLKKVSYRAATGKEVLPVEPETSKDFLPDELNSFTRASKESLPDELKNFTRTGKEILPANYNNNNIYIYGDNNKLKKKEEEKTPSPKGMNEKEAILSELVKCYQDSVSFETPREFLPLLESWIGKFGKDTVKFGISIVEQNVMTQWPSIRKWNFTKAVFHEWSTNGVTDLDSAKKYQMTRSRKNERNESSGSGTGRKLKPTQCYPLHKVHRY